MYILYFHIFQDYLVILTLLFEKALTEPADKVSHFTTSLQGAIERDAWSFLVSISLFVK